jgi:DNA transposition AAA+ family ATPase
MPGENENEIPAGQPAPQSEALDRLAEMNRVQIEARMLPTTPLTEEQIEDVRNRLRAYTRRAGINSGDVAKQCGFSRSVISEWLGGKYRGKAEGVARAVNDWMERDSRRAAAKRPKDFVATGVAEDIRTMVNLADKHTGISVIVVPAGAGKTKVLTFLAEQMRGVYLYCNEALTPREFLRSLCEKLGCKPSMNLRNKAEMLRWIIKTLTGTKRMILLDEAHQLNTAALNCVRAIYDQANVPIVMAGTADILERINDRSDGRGQFSSRCFTHNAMDKTRDVERPDGSKVGRKDLFTVEEIRAFFEMKKMRLADDAIEMCWALACLPNYGTLRLIEKTLAIVMDLEPELELVTRGHVVEALSLMMGEQQVNHLARVAARHLETARAA